MNTKIQTSLLIVIFAVSVLALAVTGKDAQQIKEKADSSNNTTVGYVYTIKDYNGKIAVFDYGDDEPITVLDCPLSVLTEKEKNMIKKGIDVSDNGELRELIEAFD